MKLHIKYFGLIAEAVGKNEEVVELNNEKNSLENLETFLLAKHYKLQGLNYKIAINQSFASVGYELKDNDELAFLPPFAGG